MANVIQFSQHRYHGPQKLALVLSACWNMPKWAVSATGYCGCGQSGRGQNGRGQNGPPHGLCGRNGDGQNGHPQAPVVKTAWSKRPSMGLWSNQPVVKTAKPVWLNRPVVKTAIIKCIQPYYIYKYTPSKQEVRHV